MATMQELKNLGKDILKLTTEVAIDIDGSEDSVIDEIILRFPDVAQDVFKELNNETLTTCRNVSRLWCDYLDDQKFCWVRMIQRYRKNMKNAYHQWKIVFKNTPVAIVKEISVSTRQFFKDHKSRINFQCSPLHIAVGQGNLKLCKYIFEKTKNTKPRIQNKWTVLHMAAEMGHEEICKFLMNNLENKNPSYINGMTPFHYAAEGGLANVCRLVIENIEEKNPAALNGSTPLHLAAKKGHLEIVRLIVETGADKNCLFDGKTSLDLVNETSFRSFTFYKLLSKDKVQICGLIFADLGICLFILFMLCLILFMLMMISVLIIGLFKFHNLENPHDIDKALKEFQLKIMWPVGILVIFVTAFLLTIIIQPHKHRNPL